MLIRNKGGILLGGGGVESGDSECVNTHFTDGRGPPHGFYHECVDICALILALELYCGTYGICNVAPRGGRREELTVTTYYRLSVEFALFYIIPT